MSTHSEELRKTIEVPADPWWQDNVRVPAATAGLTIKDYVVRALENMRTQKPDQKERSS